MPARAAKPLGARAEISDYGLKPRHAMDRQQPRRVDNQGRTFGLTRAGDALSGPRTVRPRG
jgi:hypothetical protein